MAREPRVQRVGVGLERFFERLQREMPRPDAVALAQEDMLQRGLRARFQDGELRRALQCFPAFLLGVSPGRDGGADSCEKHEVLSEANADPIASFR